MKIQIAKYSGFCFGVNSAIVKICKALKNKIKFYINGQLIHNSQITKLLKKRGLTSFKKLSEIKKQNVAIRTHGIKYSILKKINNYSENCLNLTCSKVAYIQGLIKKYSNKGYFVLIVGNPDHAEIISLKSYANNGCFIIADKNSLKSIPPANKYLLVSQTTYDRDFFNFVENKLSNQLENIEVINTICSSTHDRQKELKNAINNGIDSLVVIGGKNSSNTKKLAEIGYKHNIKTFHIETEKELKQKDFNKNDNVFITAGASTPDWIINNVIDKVFFIKNNFKNIFNKLLSYLFIFSSKLNIFYSISSFIVTSIIQYILIQKIDYTISSYSLFTILSIQFLIDFIYIDYLKYTDPIKYKFLLKYKYYLFLTIITTLIYIIYSSLFLNIYLLIFSFLLLILIFRNKLNCNVVFNKYTLSTLNFIIFSICLPYFIYNDYNSFNYIYLVLFSSIIFLRMVLLERINYQFDIIYGEKTFYSFLKIIYINNMFYIISLINLVLIIYGIIFFNTYISLILFLNFIYFILLNEYLKNNKNFSKTNFETIIDLYFLSLIFLFVLL